MKPKSELQFTPEQSDMIHAILGICGESGELLDAVKKHVIYGKPLDRENLIEELGDIEFYMQHLRAISGVTRDETLAANMAKLAKRYPDYEYTDAKAKERADKSDDGWIEWRGGECPVNGGRRVCVKLRNEGVCENIEAQAWWWGRTKGENEGDIIAYKLA